MQCADDLQPLLPGDAFSTSCSRTKRGHNDDVQLLDGLDQLVAEYTPGRHNSQNHSRDSSLPHGCPPVLQERLDRIQRCILSPQQQTGARNKQQSNGERQTGGIQDRRYGTGQCSQDLNAIWFHNDAELMLPYLVHQLGPLRERYKLLEGLERVD